MVNVWKTDTDRAWTKSVKQKFWEEKKSLLKETHIFVEFSAGELDLALRSVKKNKSSVYNGIYPKFLINIGPSAKGGIFKIYHKILNTGNAPISFKKAMVIAK